VPSKNPPIGWVASLSLAAFLLAGPTVRAEESRRNAVEVEVAGAWQSRNDVQIPNDDGGTRFSLTDVTGTGPWPAARVSYYRDIGERHGIRVRAAPLRIEESGELPGPVDFAGATFAAGELVEASYRFDSWRATYRYRFHESDRWRWWVGFTAKIRDAEIRLDQGTTFARDTDVGFVPLLYLRGEWRFARAWRARLEIDALAGGPGRAEDVLLAIERSVGDRFRVGVGYRTVEGGADTDDVFAFAWLHYATASATYRF